MPAGRGHSESEEPLAGAGNVAEPQCWPSCAQCQAPCGTSSQLHQAGQPMQASSGPVPAAGVGGEPRGPPPPPPADVGELGGSAAAPLLQWARGCVCEPVCARTCEHPCAHAVPCLLVCSV